MGIVARPSLHTLIALVGLANVMVSGPHQWVGFNALISGWSPIPSSVGGVQCPHQWVGFNALVSGWSPIPSSVGGVQCPHQWVEFNDIIYSSFQFRSYQGIPHLHLLLWCHQQHARSHVVVWTDECHSG